MTDIFAVTLIILSIVNTTLIGWLTRKLTNKPKKKVWTKQEVKKWNDINNQRVNTKGEKLSVIQFPIKTKQQLAKEAYEKKTKPSEDWIKEIK